MTTAPDDDLATIANHTSDITDDTAAAQPATDAAALIRLRMQMEFGAPVTSDLLPSTSAEPFPRVVIATHRNGRSLFTRDDLPSATREAIAALVDTAQPEFPNEAAVQALLPPLVRPMPAAVAATGGGAVPAANDAPPNIWRVCWYTIDTPPTADASPDVQQEDDGTTFVIRHEGQIVARAWTTADSPRATEVEVETHSDFRRRGYGRQVVAAWSAMALASGKAAYYSHLLHNDASRGVASSLGLTWLSDEVEYE